jgi:hypothetical protein
MNNIPKITEHVLKVCSDLTGRIAALQNAQKDGLKLSFNVEFSTRPRAIYVHLLEWDNGVITGSDTASWYFIDKADGYKVLYDKVSKWEERYV